MKFLQKFYHSWIDGMSSTQHFVLDATLSVILATLIVLALAMAIKYFLNWHQASGKFKTKFIVIAMIAGVALSLICYFFFFGGELAFQLKSAPSDSKFPWWKLIVTVCILGFGVISFLRAWTGSFFIDKRDVVKGQKSAPLPPKPYWFGVISATGFFLCVIIGLWQPLCFLGLPLFWRLGSVMMPEVTERWVPKFMNKPFLIVSEPMREHFGDWYFYGSKHGDHRDLGVNAPILPEMLVWLGIPVWLPLYSITLLRHEAIERQYHTGFVPLGDNSTANIDVRVGVITCQYPSRFLQMSSEDQATSVEVAGRVIINDVISVMSTMTFSEVKGMDTTFDEPKQDELQLKLLRAVGHAFDTLDFGDPTRDPEIEKAQNAEAAADSESQRRIRLQRAEGEAFAARVDAALWGLGKDPANASYEDRLRVLKEMRELTEAERSNIKIRGGGGVGTINVD